jgi:hypothetical protein
LTCTLENGVLKDQAGRTGYIAANYQFQFDNPPQAGSIYTTGFSVCANNSMALGGSAIWYQCLSGSFYNLYDRDWADHCNATYMLATGGSQAPPPAGAPGTTVVPTVTQISDGQSQATTVAVTQISDCQPQAPTGAPITQISDGQPQALTDAPVSQISDGQPQAPTGAPAVQLTTPTPTQGNFFHTQNLGNIARQATTTTDNCGEACNPPPPSTTSKNGNGNNKTVVTVITKPNGKIQTKTVKG